MYCRVLVCAAASVRLCISCGAECAGTRKTSVGRGWASPGIGAVVQSMVPYLKFSGSKKFLKAVHGIQGIGIFHESYVLEIGVKSASNRTKVGRESSGINNLVR